jgi:hypothetical protein
MKIKSIAILCLVFFATQSFAQQSNIATLQSLLRDLITIDASSANQSEPIITISELASAKADKSIVITKDNIGSVLAEAKNYKTSFIIVGKHTIVKITDLNNCTQSNAWATCMPKGVGYIQKGGDLINEEDYINNIIGIPDSQKRTLFLFN